MLEDKAVLEDTHRHQATGDSGETGGAKSMGKEAFIDEFAEDGDSAEDGMIHCSFSNWKIVSVGHSKMRRRSAPAPGWVHSGSARWS